MSWYWFDEGTYALSDGALTLHLLRTVVEPEERYGDSSTARLMLEYDPANDQLVVIGADEMPECTGLPLLRLDTVVDADCELDGVGEESP